jgi:hypothetical protein
MKSSAPRQPVTSSAKETETTYFGAADSSDHHFNHLKTTDNTNHDITNGSKSSAFKVVQLTSLQLLLKRPINLNFLLT